jgi:hypothetical protein
VAELKHKFFGNVWPDRLDAPTLTSLGIIVGGIAFVFVLDNLTKAHEHVPPLEAADHEPQE